MRGAGRKSGRAWESGGEAAGWERTTGLCGPGIGTFGLYVFVDALTERRREALLRKPDV